MSTLVAFFNPPSMRAAGLMPLLAREEDDTYTVRGFQDAAPRHLTSVNVNQLIEEGHVHPAPEIALSPHHECAGWLGTALSTQLEVTRTAPGLSRTSMFDLDRLGRFWLGTTEEVYSWLEAWARTAAAFVIHSRDRRLADLLPWVLPNIPIVCAARWSVSTPEEHPGLLPLLGRRMPLIEREQIPEHLTQIIHELRGGPSRPAPFFRVSGPATSRPFPLAQTRDRAPTPPPLLSRTRKAA